MWHKRRRLGVFAQNKTPTRVSARFFQRKNMFYLKVDTSSIFVSHSNPSLFVLLLPFLHFHVQLVSTDVQLMPADVQLLSTDVNWCSTGVTCNCHMTSDDLNDRLKKLFWDVLTSCNESKEPIWIAKPILLGNHCFWAVSPLATDQN